MVAPEFILVKTMIDDIAWIGGLLLFMLLLIGNLLFH